MDGTSSYQVIDLDTWPRRSHWQYYRTMVKAAVSMTKRVDVTDLLSFCHREGLGFSPVLLHTVSKTVNGLGCMRMFADEEGNPAVWDVVHPNFTLFHPEDETFSDVWIEYAPELKDFLENYRRVLSEYGDRRGIKVRDGQPPNFFPISGIPWLSYDSFTSYTAGDRPPMLFPVLNYGKYEPCEGRFIMPFSITISHAAMDGYHLAQFFQRLQGALDGFGQGDPAEKL